jgi:hypothetical protein
MFMNPLATQSIGDHLVVPARCAVQGRTGEIVAKYQEFRSTLPRKVTPVVDYNNLRRGVDISPIKWQYV